MGGVQGIYGLTFPPAGSGT